MAFKRALVVDDSRSARQSLANLLARYDLEVAFAETGEEALTFLHHELVDVIFMDHTMPGMDGLEAVAAIKGNPRTATIPVMMYTTKEGEVYVSQARALGAVAVLPKQVQPGVLFDMLHKLGLVVDRRSGEPAPAEAPRRRLTDLVDEVDREYEQRALGVSVQTLVSRILEEQHQKLRGEILAGERRIARQVVSEILEQQTSTTGHPSPPRPRAVLGGARAVAAALAVTLMALGAFTWHVMAGRDAARLEVARLTNASRHELDALSQRNDGLAATLRTRNETARAHLQTAAESVAWSFNQNPQVALDELPFGDGAASEMDGLLERLAAMGFEGRLVLTARLAPFCLDRDGSGSLVPAAPERPADACDVTGHPLQGAPLASLQSPAFAAALSEAGRYPHIAVKLAVRQPFADSEPLPSNVATAGDWNRLAAAKNRLEITLTPAPPAEVAARR